MTLCEGIRPRSRSLLGKRAREFRPSPKITFKTKREAEIWAAIYADDSCYPFHRWEVERIGAVFSAAIYDSNTGVFSHWAEP